ncbi:Oidioi.mRNA.OKI2018_I69.XSR.g16534.t1.cds [Oikopleura dioica]|uniref:Oidioi.mRNA.OKI2018_I69.XSR.g16534.t1.cds n=1 Tax=Oikopleura dioica TaxID=34765 RepID=A0ABN7SGE8_OIKDI|nr:Oidioi.mRNA.OKI2018_I69.XSR.g16534.t1.cds [Oikopleura dioica]
MSVKGESSSSTNLGKSLTTLRWLLDINASVMSRKHEKEDKVDANGNKKPSHSYADLIRMAIESTSTRQMTLNQIYEYVLENFPYYRSATHGWKNSIRHNLSLSACFQKVQRPKGHPGKGGYWTIDPNPAQSEFGRQRKRPAPQAALEDAPEAKRPVGPTKAEIAGAYKEVYEQILKPIDNGQMPAQVDFSALFNPNQTSSNSLFDYPSQLPNPSTVPSSCSSSRLPSVYSFQNSPMSTHSSDAPAPSPCSSNHSSEQFQSPNLDLAPNGGTAVSIAESSTMQQASSSLSSQGQKEGHKLLLSRQVSDPFKSCNLTDPQGLTRSTKNTPEFQEILRQLKKAESNNWEIPGNHHQLAASLSEILFRSFREQRIYDLGSGSSQNLMDQSNRTENGHNSSSEDEILGDEDYLRLANQ